MPTLVDNVTQFSCPSAYVHVRPLIPCAQPQPFEPT